MRRRLSFSLRNKISLLKAVSLCLSWSNSDRNSQHISEITAMGDASVFLLVSMVEPPRKVLSGIETMSTVRGSRGSLKEEIGVHLLWLRRDLELRELDDQVEAVVLEVETDLGVRMSMGVRVSKRVIQTWLSDVIIA